MAKKRTSLKDKNVFKRTKAIDDLIGSSSSESEEEDPMAEEKRSEESGNLAANPTESNLPLASDLSPVAEAEGETPTNEPLSTNETDEINEAEIDLQASLSAEATVAAEEPEFSLGADLDFPPALEAPPVGEADLGFPPALESPPTEGIEAITISSEISNAEDLPTGEAEINLAASLEAEATIATEDDSPILAETDLGVDLDFPPALETPPVNEADLGFPPALETLPAEDLPAGEAAMTAGTNFVDDFPVAISAINDPLSFPPALESDPNAVKVEGLPSGEAGLETGLPSGEAGFNMADTPAFGVPASDLDLGLDDFSNTPISPESAADPLNLYASTASSETDIAARAASPPLNSPPAISAPASTGVSRMKPLTFGDDGLEDTFDFAGVADESKIAPYPISDDDIEELTLEERKRRRLALEDPYTQEQYEKIHKAIDELYEEILDINVSSNKTITDWAHNLLAETQYILLNYQIEHLSKARWNIQHVKARFDRARESEKEQRKWARPIAIWGVVWFLIFVTLIFNPAPLSTFLTVTDDPAMSQLLLIPEIFLRTIFFGGLGGVTAVFYSLLKYVSERRYDKEYNVSYVFKPMMGMVMGTLIYLLIFVVSRVLGFAPPAVLEGLNTDEASKIQIFAILTYFFAMAAGFKENVAFQLLSRMMKIIFRDDREKLGETASAAPPTGPFDDNQEQSGNVASAQPSTRSSNS